jgi:hypothetical protein
MNDTNSAIGQRGGMENKLWWQRKPAAERRKESLAISDASAAKTLKPPDLPDHIRI